MWLAIDYGATCTTAVLVWPDGSWRSLSFDGGPGLSSAVQVSAAGVAVGAEAWRRAASEPAGFVASPLRVGADTVMVDGVQVEVADLVAQTLRRVADEAARMVGVRVLDAVMVVPAGWGPRRRTWLRHAARRAGLAVSRLVETPVAVAGRLPADAGDAGAVLVIDVGAGCEVSVLRRGTAGVEVLSTLADAGAGGDRMDEALTAALTGQDPAAVFAGTGEGWLRLASVRAARQALSQQVTVVVPVPGAAAPVVAGADLLAATAGPVFARVGELAGQAVANADLTIDQVGQVVLVGAAAQTPGAGQMIAATLGVEPRVLPEPGLAAVVGAAGVDTGRGRGSAAEVERLPPVRRLVTLGVPGVASLALYAHMVFTAAFYNGTPTRQGVGYYVLAVWGELTVAAVLATVTGLQAAGLLAVLLEQRHDPGSRRAAGRARITGGLVVAAGAGVAVASLYAVTAAVYMAYPIAELTRWAVLPVLPLAGCVLALAAVAGRYPAGPPGGWDTVVAFPAVSTVTVTVGTLAVAMWWHVGLPWWANGWTAAVGYAGALLMVTGIAVALAGHPAARVVLVVPLAFLTLLVPRTGPNVLAIIYAFAVAAWCARQAWALSRAAPARAGAPAH